MTARTGFVWFLPVYVSTKVNATSAHDVAGLCSAADIRSALDGHFALSYSSFGNDGDVIAGNQTVGEWKASYLSRMGRNETRYADYAAFTYDAIWVYAKALQQLIEEGEQHCA